MTFCCDGKAEAGQNRRRAAAMRGMLPRQTDERMAESEKSTLRKVLEYSAESTAATSARRGGEVREAPRDIVANGEEMRGKSRPAYRNRQEFNTEDVSFSLRFIVRPGQTTDRNRPPPRRNWGRRRPFRCYLELFSCTCNSSFCRISPRFCYPSRRRGRMPRLDGCHLDCKMRCGLTSRPLCMARESRACVRGCGRVCPCDSRATGMHKISVCQKGSSAHVCIKKK